MLRVPPFWQVCEQVWHCDPVQPLMQRQEQSLRVVAPLRQLDAGQKAGESGCTTVRPDCSICISLVPLRVEHE